MDRDIFLWALLPDVVQWGLLVAVPILRAPPWQDAVASAIPISPIPMDQLLISPIQMRALHVPITLQQPLRFLPPLQ